MSKHPETSALKRRIEACGFISVALLVDGRWQARAYSRLGERRTLTADGDSEVSVLTMLAEAAERIDWSADDQLESTGGGPRA